LSTTVTADGDLGLTLSASNHLVVVALAAAKATIMAALRLKDDDFTLDPVFPELVVATFRSLELQERALVVNASQERPVAPVPRVEVLPLVEVVSSMEVPPSV
jgi:hypothetical protein